MKVELSLGEARAYYQKKGLDVDVRQDKYVLSPSSHGEYGELNSVFPEQRPLHLVIPNQVDYLAGGGFIDPLRMMPTRLKAGWGEVALFDMDDLHALAGWATVGCLEFEQVKSGRFKGAWPVFTPTEISEARQIFVCSKWDKRVAFEYDGLKDETSLRTMLYWELSISGNDAVIYFDKLKDAYGLWGMDCFVIPLVRGNEIIEGWLEAYRRQELQLIAYSEAEYRNFLRASDSYAKKILEILPKKGRWPDNVKNIYRYNNLDGVRDEIVVQYITGTCDEYRCDEVGYQKARHDYGK